MRHGFASRRLQYVSCVFFAPAGCTGPGEQFAGREEWSGIGGAALRVPATGQLAASVRPPAAPGSKGVAVGVSRLDRNAAGRLAGDEAHYGRHPPDLWGSRKVFLHRAAASWLAVVLRDDCGVAYGRRAQRFWPSIAAMDHA